MYYGVVALLDILGARGIWHRYEINEIINSWKDIQKYLKTEIEMKKKSEYINRPKFNPELHTFSDTVILISKTEKYDPDEIMRVSSTVGSTFAHAIEKGILFRGAISIGKFYSHQNMIIGPAIDDAAEWYNITDWAGIHLTPSTTYALEGYLMNDYDIKLWLCPYDIPIKKKDGSKYAIKGWAVNWPSLYDAESHMYVTDIVKTLDYDASKPELFLQYFKRKFSMNSISEKDVSKYQNTLKFIEYAIKYYYKIINGKSDKNNNLELKNNSNKN